MQMCSHYLVDPVASAHHHPELTEQTIWEARFASINAPVTRSK
jgi:hypothetical protein